MGILYLSTSRPVNLSCRVDRSRDKYLNERHYGYAVLVHLSTCQHVKLSTRVDMSTVRKDGVFCVWLLSVSKRALSSHFILVSLRAS